MRSLWAGVRRSAFFAGIVTAGSLAVSVIALLIGNALGQVASALSAQEMARALETCSGSTTAFSRQVVQGALGGKPRSLAPAPGGEITTPEVKASFERCVEELHQPDPSGKSTRDLALWEAYLITKDKAKAEDVVHGAMLSVCLGSEQVQNIRPYFVRSVQNGARREWRRSRHYCAVVIDEPTWPPEACIQQSVEQHFLRVEMEASAHDALCDIGAEDRRILEWHLWEGLSHVDIARRLRISPEAARQRYSRALQALRGKFHQRCR